MIEHLLLFASEYINNIVRHNLTYKQPSNHQCNQSRNYHYICFCKSHYNLCMRFLFYMMIGLKFLIKQLRTAEETFWPLL